MPSKIPEVADATRFELQDIVRTKSDEQLVAMLFRVAGPIADELAIRGYRVDVTKLSESATGTAAKPASTGRRRG